MTKINPLILTGSSLSLCLALIGCGGGSSTTTTDNTQTDTTSTYTVSGTVPGTLIEAFCKDGSYYSVNSTNDGTTDHPFTLTLPEGSDCKFVMTTNENDPDTTKRIITPIVLSDGTTTSTYFQLSNDIDIGYVPLAMSGAGVQTPLEISVNDEDFHINIYAYDPLDDDGDNIPNVYEDDDDDGYTNKYDDDDDGDGIKDEDDDDYKDDHDGDGVDDYYDKDDDNDEIKDEDDDDHYEDDDDYYDNASGSSATIVLPTSYTANSGRLLGSQCAQCHGTNGVSTNSWDSIAGEDDLLDEFFEDEEPIMSAQAHGYTNEEVSLIGNWLKTLSR